MEVSHPVAVDIATCSVQFGSIQASLDTERNSFVTPDGRRVRAIAFAERSLAVAEALADSDPAPALLARLRRLSEESSSVPCPDVLLLALSGGNETAPTFAECVRIACHAAGLDWSTVQQMPAVRVDQLAASAFAVEAGWIRFEFEPTPSPVSDEERCREMLERLLARGIPSQAEFALERQNTPQSALRESASFMPEDAENGGTVEPPKLLKNRARVVCKKVNAGATTQIAAADRDRKAGLSTGPIASVRFERQTRASERNISEHRVSGTHDFAGGPFAEDTHAEFASANQGPAQSNFPHWRLAPQPINSSQGRQEEPVGGPPPDLAPFTELKGAPKATAFEAINRNTPGLKAAPTYRESSGTRQRDWLYEIAVALADECDLRGLD